MKRSNTITQRVCRAFAVVTTAAMPLIGAFFLDIANAIIIQGFISLPFFK